MKSGMWYVSVTGRTRLDDREVNLDFRVERDDRGLWHAGLITQQVDQVEQVGVCMTYANALISVINECDKLGVDVYRVIVER